MGFGTVIYASTILYLVWFVSKAIYSLYFHPLSHVPGPLFAKISPLWLLCYDLTGSRVKTLDSAHDKYGEVLRIAPNELSFSNPQMIKEIYTQGRLMKSPMYRVFELKVTNLFTSRDRAFHRDRKKLLGITYSRSTILGVEPLVIEQIQKFLNWVKKKEGTPMNVWAWYRMLTLDVVTTLVMGQAIGALDSDTEHDYLANIDNHLMLGALEWYMPWFLPLASRIPVQSWQWFTGSQERIFNYGKRAFDDYISKWGRDSGREDLLKRIIHGDKTVAPLTDEQIYSEINSQILGGTDSTSTTLSFTSWELAKRPALQNQLREELRNAAVNLDGDVVTYANIEKLPLLDAVVSEGLRLHPAVPNGLPRMAPQGGVNLGGVWVPQDTTVSILTYSTHHNAEAFPRPNDFDPDRWLNPTPEMKEAFMPFSKGPRSCIGINLAYMELKTILASLLYGWEIGVGERTTEDTMSMIDHFVLQPKGGFCDLTFTRIKSE